MLKEPDVYQMEEEGTGYLVSISDMMSGLLIIFIITLVAFIINFQDAIQRQDEEREKYENIAAILKEKNIELEKEIQYQRRIKEAYSDTVQAIVGAEEIRKNLLLKIRERLLAYGIQVQIDFEHGVLRLTEKAIRFDTGLAELADDQLEKLHTIGDILADILPCYGANPPPMWVEDGICEKKHTGKLDSVFVEGHTDNVPVVSNKWSRYQDNWELSALRSIYTYQNLVPLHHTLLNMLNLDGQPIFSVSGYGEGRPVPGHVYYEPTSDIDNRRIDLRFIMTPPSETEAEKALKEAGVK